jgi:dTDP-4-dehydrorhamnose 3,5-epimerase
MENGSDPRINGVRILDLTTHDDDRGALTEVFRDVPEIDLNPVQWNYVRSHAGVLRGVHAHLRHTDYLIVLEGSAIVGMKDLRPGSPTRNAAMLLRLSGDELQALVIPPGVAHGFYYERPTLHLYAVDCFWDPADELGCAWNDPGLNLPWPCANPYISMRDSQLPGFSAFALQIEEGLAGEALSLTPA